MPKLTVSTLEAFQRSDQKKMSDTQQRGLVVRRKAGWPTFYLRTQVSGQDIVWLLGAWRRELEIEDARRFASDLIYDLQRGITLTEEHVARKRVALGLDDEIVAPGTKPPFGQAVQDYLRHVKEQRREMTWVDYTKALREPLLNPLRDKPVDRIKREDLAEIVDKISLSGRQRTAEKLAVILSALWKFLAHDTQIRTYGVERGMLSQFKPLSRTGNRVEKRTAECEVIAEVLTDRHGELTPQMGAAVALTMLTAQRVRTVATAKREHFTDGINYETGRETLIWNVPADIIKSKRPHAIPLPERARWIVERVESGWLFPSESGTGHMDSGSITHAFGSRLLDLRFSPHRVRTAFTTEIRRAGMDKFASKLILDHNEGRDQDVTMEHYDFWQDIAKKELLVDIWIAALDGDPIVIEQPKVVRSKTLKRKELV